MAEIRLEEIVQIGLVAQFLSMAFMETQIHSPLLGLKIILKIVPIQIEFIA